MHRIGLFDLKFWLCQCQSSTTHIDPSNSEDQYSFKTDDFLSKWLVEEGFFPTSPSLIRTAVSIHFLKFLGYVGLRSGGAVTAFSGAMKDFYADDGIYIINSAVWLHILLCDSYAELHIGNVSRWSHSPRVGSCQNILWTSSKTNLKFGGQRTARRCPSLEQSLPRRKGSR